MSRAALPWLMASLLLHAGWFGFARPLGHRSPAAWQQTELALLEEAPAARVLQRERSRTQALPLTRAMSREARVVSLARESTRQTSEDRVSNVVTPATAEPPSASPEPEPEALSSGDSGAPASGRARSGSAPASSGGQSAIGAVRTAAATLDPSATRARYLRALRERVLARREYPHAAQRAGLQGTVCVRFSVNASGRLSALGVTCGAAPQLLQEAALRAVRSAAPFAPLPSSLGTELSVDLPVLFQLDAL